MLKPGGIIIHASPSHNHIDHGFYMFSPQVYYDYYSLNRFEILRSNIFEYEKDHAGRPWLIYEYKPGSIDHLSLGGWRKKLLGIWFVARKRVESTCGEAPMQGSYIHAWSQNGIEKKFTQMKPTATPIKKYLVKFIKNLLKKNKYVYNFTNAIWISLRSKRPKIIARY